MHELHLSNFHLLPLHEGHVKDIVVARAGEILMMCCILRIWLFLIIRQRSDNQCYLMDFTCYKPPTERLVSKVLSIYFTLRNEPINVDNANFFWKFYQRSGLGEETCVPRRFFNDGNVATLEEVRVEMEESFVSVLDELFAKTCMETREIDILIVNVSTFSAAPSLTA